jgi:5-formyltetrahydrofolate cyclo-ligase
MPERMDFRTKKELRAEMKKRSLSLAPGERAAASERIFGRVGGLASFADARCVALFCALPDEPATDAALVRWSAVKRIVLPRVEGDTMRFCDYDPAALGAGAFGIAEPGSAAAACDPTEIDLVVVPGTAFTRAGARMGRGRGYYDRYLSQPGFRAVKIGVCYAHQLVGELPVEPHDVFMDYVITNE